MILKYLFIIFLLVFIIKFYILINKKHENFKVSNKYKDFFSLDIFDNKDIYLIANNSKLSSETKEFFKNIDYNKSVIVRFNGYKNLIKDYANGKTDIMIYRQNRLDFHGYDKKTYNKNVINVFTLLDKDKKSQEKLNKIKEKDFYILKTDYLNKLEKDNKSKKTLTTGFSLLYNIKKRKKINCKKIYLVGFTFHNKNITSFHDEKVEYDYFKKHFKGEKDIILLS